MLKNIKKSYSYFVKSLIVLGLLGQGFVVNAQTQNNQANQTLAKQNDGFTIDINWQNNSRIGIDVIGLDGNILQTLGSDFARSGKLAIQNVQSNNQTKSEYVLTNQVSKNGHLYSVTVNLLKEGKSLGAIQLNSSSESGIAHRISDFVYEIIFKKRGAFSTRLSYVVEKNRTYMLMISDSDGTNANVALQSKEPIISIAWSPTGREVAYVSFEDRKPVVYIHHLASGKRRVLSNYAGNNSAPSWSPDGKELVLALSISGNTQIYKINSNGGNLTRLTNSRDGIIDTEPQFSHDGQAIYFTSDRGGEPQIYKMSKDGEEAETAKRITFKGIHNTSPRISPDGEHLAYINKGNGFKVHIQNLSNNNVYSISETTADENPSFAANGDYIIYATKVKGKNSLVASPVEGGGSYILSLPYARIKQPTWGPFMQ
ncbi:MAG: Dipeptidyl-peptidase 5 [Pseudomonadota bacterium]|jgi:TolB protein